MLTKNRLTDNQIISNSNQLLEENSIQIHRWLLLTVGVFAFVFSIISVLLGDYTQAWISMLSVPGVFIAHLLNKKGFTIESKIFNSIQIIIMLAAICLLTGINSLAFMYYFPIIISILLAFEGRDKKTAFGLILFILLILVGLTAISEPIGQNHWNPEHLFLDRLSNIIGVALSCIVIIFLLIKTMNNVQSHLIENTNYIKENNTQLLAANYTQDQLMSVIAHDLRAPMASAIMTTEACLKEDTSDESKKEMLLCLRNKATQILTMTDQLLDWSRSQTGNLSCELAPVPVEQFSKYVNDWTNLIGESKDVHFDIDFNFQQKETILCDRNMIETALRNIISNAVKFSSIGSVIKIRSQKIENKRSFEVEDFGKGINEKQLEKLREGISFTTPGTNNEKGNGFGLLLVQEFLRRHKSHLEIQSEFGNGSVFSFNL